MKTHDQFTSYRVFFFTTRRGILLVHLITNNYSRRATSAKQSPTHLLVILKHKMIIHRRASNRPPDLREVNLLLTTNARPMNRLCNIEIVASANDVEFWLNVICHLSK